VAAWPPSPLRVQQDGKAWHLAGLAKLHVSARSGMIHQREICFKLVQVVVATVAALLCACAVVLVAVGSEGVVAEVEMLSEPMSALGRGEKQKSVRRAFSQLNGLDDTAAARLEELAPMNWLEKIYGRDNTYDFDALKNLKAGDVSEAGYDGMPQIKGAIPTPQVCFIPVVPVEEM
jgi:hypothetical protein